MSNVACEQMKVSLQEMKARWVFTEIRSDRTRKYYHDSRVPMLQSKLKDLVFSNVTMQDRDTLATMWEDARGKYLWMYLTGVSNFILQYWSAVQLGQVWRVPRGRAPARDRAMTMRQLNRVMVCVFI